MKNKILVLTLIAAVLTAGLILVGCGSDTKCPNGDGKCKAFISHYKDRDNSIKDCSDHCVSAQMNAAPPILDDRTFSCNCD